MQDNRSAPVGRLPFGASPLPPNSVFQACNRLRVRPESTACCPTGSTSRNRAGLGRNVVDPRTSSSPPGGDRSEYKHEYPDLARRYHHVQIREPTPILSPRDAPTMPGRGDGARRYFGNLTNSTLFVKIEISAHVPGCRSMMYSNDDGLHEPAQRTGSLPSPQLEREACPRQSWVNVSPIRTLSVERVSNVIDIFPFEARAD